MDRWDSFYMGRLEPRMIGAATSLANLDANVKHLQERAHVWDTFQHHVSAWNDQIKTLDRKLDIINKEQQRIESLESKLIPFNDSSFENKLNELENKLDSLNGDVQNPIFNEFAGRGILHTIKNLEKKLDKLQVALDKTARSPDSETSDFLKEISVKIDGILGKNEIEDGDGDVRHLGRTCRRLVGPFKKLINSMEALQGSVKEMTEVEAVPAQLEKSGKLKNSVLVDIKRSLNNIEDEIEELQKKNAKNINENERILRRIAKKLDSEIEEDDDDDEDLKKSLKRVIVDQREKLEDFIKKNVWKLKKEIDELEDDIEDLDDDDDKDKDDSDDDDSRDRRRKDSDDSDDDDDDDDDDSNDRRKGRRKNKKDDDSDDDDDDDDDDDSDDNSRRRKSKNRSDDDDDDDDDDSDDRKHSRRRNKNKSDDDDDDDDSDSDDKPRRRKSKKDCDTDEDDDDDDTRERKKKGRKHRKNKKDDSDDDDDDDDDDNDSNNTKSKKDDSDDDDDDDDDNSKNNDLTLDPNNKIAAEKSTKLKDVEEISKHDVAENLAADGPSNTISSFFGIPSSAKTNSVIENEIKGRK